MKRVQVEVSQGEFKNARTEPFRPRIQAPECHSSPYYDHAGTAENPQQIQERLDELEGVGGYTRGKLTPRLSQTGESG